MDYILFGLKGYSFRHIDLEGCLAGQEQLHSRNCNFTCSARGGKESKISLLSEAARDASGLPSRALLESPQEYNLLRTDRDGWIEISTDGEQMWVEAAR